MDFAAVGRLDNVYSSHDTPFTVQPHLKQKRLDLPQIRPHRCLMTDAKADGIRPDVRQVRAKAISGQDKSGQEDSGQQSAS